jgi:DNA-binding NarL/FixJ family response regulator
MIRVLVADDHAVVRKGLSQIIEEAPGIELAAEAASGAEVLTLMREQSFDIVMLDINMPGMDGLDALKQIRSEHPDQAVLVLSMHAEEHYAVRVLRAGARGYLNKESAADELVEALRRVSEGKRYVSPEVAESLLDYIDQPTDAPLHAVLSDREFQVLCLLSQGLAVSRIGEELSLSVKTISTYRARILEKMGMSSNAELTRYAIENDLVY